MKRSKHSLSHYRLTTANMGDLVPVGLTEVLPGDTIQQATSAVIRVSPMLAPVMHPVHARIHHWFVPHRLVWDDWEDFITGGEDGMDASVFPTITAPAVGGVPENSLSDYLGIVPGVGSLEFSALPSRGYNLIWNEWYRDQDLQTEAAISTASGADSTTQQILRQVCWEKDYYTVARPWEAKGPSITMPMAQSAPVVSNTLQPTFNTGAATNQGLSQDTAGKLYLSNTPGSPQAVTFGNQSGLEADLANVGATLNEVREAFALWRYQEARARYGSRYTEYLRYLGVRSSDARLQRPEYLGGGKQTIQFSEVIQSSPTTDGDDTEGVGNLKGHGIGSMRSNRFRTFFEEHGYVFTFLSVKPTTMYANGLHRTWNRRTKEDFFQKELQFIGQQPILNKEVYAGAASPNDTFGYGDRYDEYRRGESQIAGEFRTSLSFWHMGRLFSSTPALNGDFVKCVPTDRIYASTTSAQLQIMANHSIQARRIIAASGGESSIR